MREKYKIKQMLGKIPTELYKSKREELISLLGISDSQFRRICNIQEGSPSCIDSKKLVIIADFFGVSVDYILGRCPQNDVVRATEAGPVVLGSPDCGHPGFCSPEDKQDED